MEVAKAVMVTAELDFGPKVPSIAEALNQIERRYQPDDGQGRTFAVLDAYGEPTPDGKLHIPGMPKRYTRARLLAAPATPVKVTSDHEGFNLELPAKAPDAVASVIALEVK